MNVSVVLPTYDLQSVEDANTMWLVAAALTESGNAVTVFRHSGDQRPPSFIDEELFDIKVLPTAEPQVWGAFGTHYDNFRCLDALSDFDEIHALDRGGLLNYVAMAKRLGLGFLGSTLSCHVVGGEVFRLRCGDHLVSSVVPLVSDALELGWLKNADRIVVHDPVAWQWWTERAELKTQAPVAFVGTTNANSRLHEATYEDLSYWGPLAIDGGLAAFCDTINHLHKLNSPPHSVTIAGNPGPVGGRDGISYLFARAQGWICELNVVRTSDPSEQYESILNGGGPVYIDTSRRQHLAARLATMSPLQTTVVDGLKVARQPVDIAHAFRSPTLADADAGADQLNPIAEMTARIAEAVAPEPTHSADPLAIDLQGPLVSVCMAHHERPELLWDALRSLDAQTYENMEVVVVDDGSLSGATIDALDEIETWLRDRGWKLVRQDNRYLGAARNQAASHATGSYLMFMDDDNLAHSDELATMVAVAERESADVITCHLDFFGESPGEGISAEQSRFGPIGANEALGSIVNCFGDANGLVRRTTFERLGGFSELYGVGHEDWEFFSRARFSGASMVAIPRSLFSYRVDSSGMLRGSRAELRHASDLALGILPYVENLPYEAMKVHLLVQGLLGADQNTSVGQPVVSVVSEQTRLAQDAEARETPFARVAVVTRTKDRPVLLRRAIESVVGQTFGDWLMIIVNDGGDPMLVDQVVEDQRIALAGRVIVVHHPESQGMQNASNAGIFACDSEMVIIHDDDDSWYPDFLSTCVSHLDSNGWNPSIGGVVTQSELVVEDIDESGQPHEIDQFVFNPDLVALSLRDLAVENRFPPISFLFFRTSLESVGPFDESAGPLGDWDFHLRVLERFDIDVVDQPLARYHHRRVGTEGAYGNSVHANELSHRRHREQMVNRIVRDENNSLGHLMSLGDMQHSLQTQSQAAFAGLEAEVRNAIGAIQGATSAPVDHVNLYRDGLFAFVREFRAGPNHAEYAVLSDGIILSSAVEPSALTVDLSANGPTWPDDLIGKDVGKVLTFSASEAIGGKYLNVGLQLPGALAGAGKLMTYSISALAASETPVVMAAFHRPRPGTRLAHERSARATVSNKWQRIHLSNVFPMIGIEDVDHGHMQQFNIGLPTDRPFTLSLVGMQLAAGPFDPKFVLG